MRKSLFILLALIFTTLCSDTQLFAQVTGEGDIVREEITLEALRGIHLAISAEVILTQGSPQKIVMEGQKNVLDNIKRDVRNGVWKIGQEKNMRQVKKVTIHITMSVLEDIAVSGSGKVRTEGTFRNVGDLKTAVSGSGKLTLSVEARNIKSAISGSGSIELSGSAHRLDAAVSGSGKILALDVLSEECKVAISGSGNARVHCTQAIDSTIAGSGNVRYKGNPDKVKATVAGSGNITSID